MIFKFTLCLKSGQIESRPKTNTTDFPQFPVREFLDPGNGDFAWLFSGKSILVKYDFHLGPAKGNWPKASPLTISSHQLPLKRVDVQSISMVKHPSKTETTDQQKVFFCRGL